MLTLFATPKPFQGHIGVIQRNAIKSWTMLRPTPEIVLLCDEEGTEETAQEFGLKFVPDVVRNEFGTPMVDSCFKAAEEAAENEFIGYVNADIILLSDFMPAMEQVCRDRQHFLMCGQRWNLDVEEPLAFDSDWEECLRSRIAEQGNLYVRTGIDYYVFRRGLFGEIPPFAVGRRGDDNWFLYQARIKKATVIDVTQVVTAVHQTHDYSHHPDGKQGIFQGAEYQRNIALVGDHRHSFTLDDRTEILSDKGLKPALDAKRLWRFIRTAPALYPNTPLPVRLVFDALNGVINVCRQLGHRTGVIRSADL